MKLIKRLLLCFIILIPFLASCSNDSDTNEQDEYGAYLYLERAIYRQSFELGDEREIRNIHFSTEGYNYYGDFKILIDDTVIFDMADYDYFLPATDDLCIPVEIDSEAENKISVNVGDDFIKTDTSLTTKDDITYLTYYPGQVELVYGFDNSVTLSNDIELVEGNSKFVFKGYQGYLNINNENVSTSIDTFYSVNKNELFGCKINIVNVKADCSCVITNEDITYNPSSKVIHVFTNDSEEKLAVESNIILNNSNQVMRYMIDDNPESTDRYLCVDIVGGASIKEIRCYGNSTYEILNNIDNTITIWFELVYPQYPCVEIDLCSTGCVAPDIVVYRR